MTSYVPHITVVTVPGCHLCAPAVAAVQAVAQETSSTWEEVLLSEVPDPDPQWREQVPVTLIDGVVHDVWRVRPARLREALAAARSGAL